MPQAKLSTQHQGQFNVDNSTISNALNTTTSATPPTFNHITDNRLSHLSWIKRDRLLSEVNSILTNNLVNPFDTMTKTMDLFSDPHSCTVIPNSIAGFDEPLMTPIIDPDMYFKEKEMARPWLSSSTDTLDKEDFIGFEELPISMSSVLNSPPESVKSNHIYEDDSNTMYNTSELMDTEQSFNIVLAEPYNYNTQEYFLHSDFHQEIDQIANEHKYSMPTVNRQQNLMNIVKCENTNESDDDDDDEDDTPIFGNADIMISSPSSATVVNSQEQILNETLNNNNSNTMNMNAQSTLLTKRNQCLPQLKLTATVKMMPIENCIGSTPAAPVPPLPSPSVAAAAATTTSPAAEKEKTVNNANTVISTPQLEDEILEMESDFPNFDLVSYINNDTNNTRTTSNTMIEVNSIKQEVEHDVSISNIEQILPTPVASPNIKSMQHAGHDDEIDDKIISSVSSTVVNERAKRVLKRRAAVKKDIYDSEDEFQQPKRPRGRPPKSEPTQLSPSELKRLSPKDRRYYEMRLKNNEASRRSRLSRKSKEDALFDELTHLSTINEDLKKVDTELDRQIKSWEKKFLKLATL